MVAVHAPQCYLGFCLDVTVDRSRYNATLELLPNATLQWYDRGGFMYDGVGTGYFAKSGYYVLDEPGAMFSTSLYTLGELGYTREQCALIGRHV